MKKGRNLYEKRFLAMVMGLVLTAATITGYSGSTNSDSSSKSVNGSISK